MPIGAQSRQCRDRSGANLPRHLAVGLLLACAATLIGAPAGAIDGRTGTGGPTIDFTERVYQYFRGRLPFGWWISPPVRVARRLAVVVNIPDDWNGNPSGAMMILCPDRRDKLWLEIDLMNLQPAYRNLRWGDIECRQ